MLRINCFQLVLEHNTCSLGKRICHPGYPCICVAGVLQANQLHHGLTLLQRSLTFQITCATQRIIVNLDLVHGIHLQMYVYIRDM